MGKSFKNFIAKRLFSFLVYWELHSEFSDAAGTLLLDIENRKWSGELCEYFGIDEDILTDLVDSMACVGTV